MHICWARADFCALIANCHKPVTIAPAQSPETRQNLPAGGVHPITTPTTPRDLARETRDFTWLCRRPILASPDAETLRQTADTAKIKRTKTMKKIALLAAALTAVAPAAFAYAPNELSPAQLFEAKQYVPNADLSNLSAKQALQIAAILSSDDSGKGAAIYSTLNAQ